MDLEIRQLPSGYWHIRGDGPCNWAQPPTWPCTQRVLDKHTFPEADERFRRELRWANQDLRYGYGAED